MARRYLVDDPVFLRHFLRQLRGKYSDPFAGGL